MRNSGKRRTAAVLGAAVVLVVGTSCSPDGPRRAAVAGKVLVDQQPLVAGSINFFPVDGTAGPSAGTVIKNGAYQIARAEGVVVGKNRVEIRGFRKTGRTIPDPMARTAGRLIEEIVPALPPESNDRSTLVRDIRDGDNTLDFDLPGTKDR